MASLYVLYMGSVMAVSGSGIDSNMRLTMGGTPAAIWSLLSDFGLESLRGDHAQVHVGVRLDVLLVHGLEILVGDETSDVVGDFLELILKRVKVTVLETIPVLEVLHVLVLVLLGDLVHLLVFVDLNRCRENVGPHTRVRSLHRDPEVLANHLGLLCVPEVVRYRPLGIGVRHDKARRVRERGHCICNQVFDYRQPTFYFQNIHASVNMEKMYEKGYFQGKK